MVGQRGGSREGAGRKSLYDEPTKVVRVPESRVIEIKNYLVQSKEARFNDVASITLVDRSTSMHIPLASEKVAAGFPSPAQDYVDKTLDMNEHLIQNEAATFIVKVASLSMRDAGIDIDDELVVDRSIEAKHEDIVIALIDNEFTVKRLMIEADSRWLKAENPEFSDIHLKDGQEMIIWGVVTYVLKPFRKRK
ncbi:translesion error-prone DNA polymerase V autoproteolytic subunit [Acinetobacter baumannii]|uniref:LexA family protein n=1 Tax=Acinetobacter calcoaceticus/baumannii complex TaxID=909768 RepID=UPI0002AED56C|nr:translesion error-prone DNA polymerase V autoproteolytic subunit [Acinetobacter baumannii]EKX8607533.1 translesion error-prone DNA polymerase V autoproteolytic subunit [Acinetobacter baumannii]ELW77826.1 peptidase S24-like protein [Acinetobacter baumannii WC-A-92]MCZ0697028.1 translesion error-prone DNA polymerase V autoproteolytic subunit [Acinetobacter baumannii]MDC4348850.1 translesion error-prone DNA polymerase V autoproteolytic subunit [Acinetobacter baumannii]MDO7388374.1 translesion 